MTLFKSDTSTIATTGQANISASSKTQTTLQDIANRITTATSQQQNEFVEAVKTKWAGVKPKFDELVTLLNTDGKAISDQADLINKGFKDAQTSWLQ